jgi:hypothetical protein
MNAANVHLLINHFPIILSVVGAGAALLAVFSRHRSTWVFALAALLLAGLAVYPAFFTGQGAEQVMEKAWYIERDVVHEHEEAAEFALWITLLTGALAAFAMWRERTAFTGGRKVLAAPAWLRALTAVVALLAAATLARTAWTAGFIVHKTEKLQSPPASGAAPSLLPTDTVGSPLVTPPTGTTTGATTGAMTPDTLTIRPPR